MDLKTLVLLQLQTRYMQDDLTTQAICSALNPVLLQLSQDIDNCLIMANIEEQPEQVLDELAYELHVEWYDASADITVKRDLIKNSDKVHMFLGTPYAVEQVVQDFFGDGYVEEWFEYSGVPYHFRVITSNPSVTGEQAIQFQKAIESVKRVSAVLDQVIIAMTAQVNEYTGLILHTGDFYTVEQVVA